MQVLSDPPLDCVEQLLIRSELPVEDIDADSPVRFFGCGVEGSVSGVIGLEAYGSVGLLRSLAVDDSRRGDGLGKLLVAHLEQEAAEIGLTAIYLLTETAERFFLKLGYIHLTRDEAPDDIRATEEFRCLCPESAEFMVKHLGSNI